ncbi:MAG: hypothetical protein R3324_01945 [Halobacteriales archaeon]|nr:hypothetical protein [Halobacteriales archaeon]
MAAPSEDPVLDRLSPQEINVTIGTIMKMDMVRAVFVIVGYPLILGALVLELTAFHPLIEEYFTRFTAHSLAGGGPDRAGATG